MTGVGFVCFSKFKGCIIPQYNNLNAAKIMEQATVRAI